MVVMHIPHSRFKYDCHSGPQIPYSMHVARMTRATTLGQPQRIFGLILLGELVRVGRRAVGERL